jgi:hypothetical protein
MSQLCGYDESQIRLYRMCKSAASSAEVQTPTRSKFLATLGYIKSAFYCFLARDVRQTCLHK